MPGTLSDSKKELLSKLLRGGANSGAKRPAIPRRSPDVDIPVSFGQRQVWLHSQFSTKLPIYNEPVTIHRSGPLDRIALEKAFTEVVRRHEAWRTTFGWKGGELVQIVQPAPAHIEIPFLDVSTLPANERRDAAVEIATADALAAFDLAVGPMYRPRLIRFSADEHRMYLTLHHIIFDGMSLYQVFLPELQTLYEAYSEGMPSPLEDPQLQYADFAVWQRGWVEEIAPAQIEYWQAKLKGATWRDVLAIDNPRQPSPSYRGAMLNLALDRQTTLALKELSQRSGITLFMTLLATFYTLLWAHSQQEDLIIGVTSAGRNRTELEGMLGCFLNTIMLRADLSGDPSFLELAMQCKDELFSGLANDGLPFERLVKELSGPRDGSRHPFFQVLFSYEPPLAPLQPGWNFSRMDVETGSAKFDLHLELDDFPDGIAGRFVYNADLFKRSTIEQMLADWRYIVAQVIASPSRAISEIVPPRREVVAKIEAAPIPVVTVAAAAEPMAQEGIFRSLRKLFRNK